MTSMLIVVAVVLSFLISVCCSGFFQFGNAGADGRKKMIWTYITMWAGFLIGFLAIGFAFISLIS